MLRPGRSGLCGTARRLCPGAASGHVQMNAHGRVPIKLYGNQHCCIIIDPWEHPFYRCGN